MRLKRMDRSLRCARVASALLLLPAQACEATPQGLGDSDAGDPGHDGGTITGTGPYCEVMRQVFLPYCASCHNSRGTPPDLSYEGGKSSLINVMSQVYPGQTFVVPGSPSTSFLYRKLSGELTTGEGNRMPAAAPLSGEQVQQIQRWIAEGASLECTQVTIEVDGGLGRAHPEGFREPAVHGTEMKLQMQDCRTCHGADLTGAAGPSCDGCHQAEWRTNCTYCHGGTDSTLGAPPRDLSGVVEKTALTFQAHTPHTTTGQGHPAYDCTQCHQKPEHVLSEGHAFDDTPGRSEVNFGAGLSATGVYAGNGACNNLYCHGNGRGTLGMYSHDQAAPECGSCHAVQSSGSTAWRTLSGDHRTHLSEGITCSECHGGVIDPAGAIIGPDLHVDGQKALVFSATGFTRTNARCSGTCHNERHTNRTW